MFCVSKKLEIHDKNNSRPGLGGLILSPRAILVRAMLASDFFEQLLIDVEIGMHVLDVVMLFERFHQPDHGAGRGTF
jgi:hypothetical protein